MSDGGDGGSSRSSYLITYSFIPSSSPEAPKEMKRGERKDEEEENTFPTHNTRE